MDLPVQGSVLWCRKDKAVIKVDASKTVLEVRALELAQTEINMCKENKHDLYWFKICPEAIQDMWTEYKDTWKV